MLKEYHKFSYKGNYYLFHVEDMKAYRINKALYDEIADLSQNIDPQMEKALTKLNLLKKKSKNVSEENEAGNNVEISNKDIANNPVTHISLNVTQSCNLQCIYCYGDGGEYDGKGFMTFEIAKKSIDWLIYQSKEEKRLVVTFFGGEPLLNFTLIKKVVKYAKTKAEEHNKDIFFTITTNGTLLDEEKQKYLISNNITVVLSIDGNLKMMDNNRPFKNNLYSHKTTIKNVKSYLSKKNGKVTARATITKYNSQLNDVVMYLEGIGFKNVYMTDAAFPQKKELKIKNKANLELKDQIENFKYLENLAEDTIASIKEKREIVDKAILIYVKRLYKRGKKKYYCGVGRGLVGISKTGDIYPCHRFVGVDELVMGNTQKIENFNNSFYLSNEGILSKVCNKCWAKYLCGGGCIYESFQENGSFNIPDNKWCMKLKKTVELSIYVYDKLNVSDKKYLDFLNAENSRRKP